MRILLGLVACVLLAGCCNCNESAQQERFQVVSQQYIKNDRHNNFTIMVIKDTKTEKEFKVIFNSSWGFQAD